MPGFFRKLFGLKPKPKVKVPNFRNGEEYSLWRQKVYGEPLPQKIVQLREAIKQKQIEEAKKEVTRDKLRVVQEQHPKK